MKTPIGIEKLGWLFTLLCLAGVGPGATASRAAATYPLLDSFENGPGNWTMSGGWAATTARYASPTHAATDSPGTFYANGTDASMALKESLNLTGATRPAISFQHSYSLEFGYDFGSLELSTNGGASWQVIEEFTGEQSAMTREQADLSSVAGLGDVRVRFRLLTDASVVMDGWYVDDVSIGEAPAPVTLQTATNPTPNSIALSWSPASEPNFAAYRLYRSRSPNLDWHTAQLVGEVTNVASTNYTDITVSPKTTYHYAVMTLNTSALHSMSATVQTNTPAGMDYPFLDNGEGGAERPGVATAPWALSDERRGLARRTPGRIRRAPITPTASAHRRLHSRRRCPWPARPVAPVLSFNHKYDFAAGDSGNVEVSLNNGADWTSLASFTGNSSNAVAAGALQSGRLHQRAFRVWCASVSPPIRPARPMAGTWTTFRWPNRRAVVNAPVLDQVTSHSIRVSWAANTDPLFSHYAVFRSTTAGVGINSTLVAIIPDQSATTFTDTNLALDTVYYYRVYAVNPYGTFSADSATESSTRTLNNPLPFSDDFEGSLVSWNFTGSWGLATNEVHAGVACLTDSPGSNYMNNVDTYALTAVNLVGTSWPVLRFWDRHRMADNDWARLEISTDGSSWTPLYGSGGHSHRVGGADALTCRPGRTRATCASAST